MGFVACVLLLVPLVGVEQPWSAITYLVLSPSGAHVVLLYHYEHPKLRYCVPLSALAFSIASGGSVASLILPPESRLGIVFPCISASLFLGSLVMLLAMDTSDIANVISCTACGMWILVLACTPAVTSPAIAFHCYRCTSVPILFMFWRCGCGRKTVVTDSTV